MPYIQLIDRVMAPQNRFGEMNLRLEYDGNPVAKGFVLQI